ncbi:MAG TPA: hypothetical protein VEU30_13575, partial [Thermoanaerobaculia bacterium]|nr:hypothetical protein [Thermoanaerobaculia bacterium]
MKNLALLFVLLQVLVLPASAADAPRECTLCVGITGSDGADVPVLARVTEDELAAFAPARPQSLTVVVSYSVDTTAGDPLLNIEEHTKTILDWARTRGPFDGLGVTVSNATPEQTAYAIKRLAVSAQGLDVAKRIVVERSDSVAEAMAYFDALLVPAADVEAATVWLAERDPSKKIYAVVDVTSPNALFDLG